MSFTRELAKQATLLEDLQEQHVELGSALAAVKGEVGSLASAVQCLDRKLLATCTSEARKEQGISRLHGEHADIVKVFTELQQEHAEFARAILELRQEQADFVDTCAALRRKHGDFVRISEALQHERLEISGILAEARSSQAEFVQASAKLSDNYAELKQQFCELGTQLWLTDRRLGDHVEELVQQSAAAALDGESARLVVPAGEAELGADGAAAVAAAAAVAEVDSGGSHEASRR